MIHLGQNLGLVITGEGIENAEQAERLLALDAAKGFYFHQPGHLQKPSGQSGRDLIHST
ncbi:hypothetical protein AiwAL_10375 [Acidiphilium sp. AL]|uniref:hypothetical protein n=1 Tax=Acidiphilium sp. AL TaxID=2871704 RepID=UPI0021CB41D5|nr:hypothetical protein [Acidiphilium sp. AL]MCU4160509.1 hypothetical protein [Acidiphilium sp. AL]